MENKWEEERGERIWKDKQYRKVEMSQKRKKKERKKERKKEKKNK